MARNWGIAIGINTYTNLQPLQYGKADAEAMRDWFEKEASFDKVFLFTEDSPEIKTRPNPIPTKPTFGHVRRFLRSQFQEKKSLLKPGDNLWFFFAGHGRREGGRDYLMLSDSDPGDVTNTAIEVNFVTSCLRECGADNVVLFLDACRNQEGTRKGQGIGLEKHQGVVIFYSCSANESSYEVQELSHGVFTKFLLEGLSSQGKRNCATVEKLEQYLQETVPSIASKYRKQKQNPYASVEPTSKRHLILLPQQATSIDIEKIKKEASSAYINQNITLSEKFWLRVLAVSPGDEDALNGLKRIWLDECKLEHQIEIKQLKEEVELLKQQLEQYDNQKIQDLEQTKPSDTTSLATKPRANLKIDKKTYNQLEPIKVSFSFENIPCSEGYFIKLFIQDREYYKYLERQNIKPAEPTGTIQFRPQTLGYYQIEASVDTGTQFVILEELEFKVTDDF